MAAVNSARERVEARVGAGLGDLLVGGARGEQVHVRGAVVVLPVLAFLQRKGKGRWGKRQGKVRVVRAGWVGGLGWRRPAFP